MSCENSVKRKLVSPENINQDLLQMFHSTSLKGLKLYPEKLNEITETSAYARVCTSDNPNKINVVKKTSLCWLMLQEPIKKVSNDRLKRVQRNH